MSTRSRVFAVLLALVCGGILGSRTYLDFERVRIRAVKQPIVAEDAELRVSLRDLDRLGGGPAALIIHIRALADGEFSFALDGRELDRVTVTGGEQSRHDLIVFPPADGEHELVLGGSHSGWALTSVEISNIHGQSRGWVDFVIVPDARGHDGVPVAFGILLFALVALVPPTFAWPRSAAARYLHRTAAAAIICLFAATLIAPLFTSYRVLFAATTVVLFVAVLYLERSVRLLAQGASHAAPVLRRFRPRTDARPDLAPLPSAGEVALAGVGFLLATFIVLHAQVVQLGSVPDLGDPLFSMWRMGWVKHQLGTDPWHLFDANIFYPDRGTLTYSDAMLLPALVYVPLSWAGIHPVTAYNLLFLAAFPLSAVAAYLFARSIALGVPAAATSGFIFGFSTFRFEHYSHLELQMTFWMPLAALGIHRLVVTGSRPFGALAALAVAAQWYSSMYFGLFLSAFLAVFGLVLVRRVRRRGAIRDLAVALALSSILAAPLGAAYAAFGEQRGERPPNVVTSYSATPMDYLQSTDRRAAYAWMRWGTPHGERQLFPGVLPILLAVLGAWPPLSATRLALLVAGLFAFDGSLGFNGLWYPLAYELLFPFQSIRVPARFAQLVGLALALLAGAGVQRWTARLAKPKRNGVLLLLGAALLVDVWPRIHLVPVWRTPPPIYEPLKRSKSAVLLEYPLNPAPEAFSENLPYMYFSLWHWARTVNGYSGNLPETYAANVERLRGFPAPPLVATARDLGVTHISVVCGLDGHFGGFGVPVSDRDKCSRTIAILDANPAVRALVRAEWEGEPALLYEVLR